MVLHVLKIEIHVDVLLSVCSLQTQLNSRLSYLSGHTHASVLRMLSGGVSVDKADWLLPETRKRFDDQANRLRQRKEGITFIAS